MLVHVEVGRELAGGRQPLARRQVALHDARPDLPGELLEERHRGLRVDDEEHAAEHIALVVLEQ